MAVLGHARLSWDAEVENARRLGTRANGILTLVVALMGLGVSRLGTMEAFDPTWLLDFLRILLAGSVILMFAAFCVLLQPRKRDLARPLASSLLHWPTEPNLDPFSLTDREVAQIAHQRITRATLELQRRNGRKQADIDRSQNLLLGAGLLSGLAILCYLERLTR